MMTNQSFATPPFTLETGPTARGSHALLTHSALIAAMTVVAAALGVFAAKTLGLPPFTAGTLGFAALSASIITHTIIASRSRAPKRQLRAAAPRPAPPNVPRKRTVAAATVPFGKHVPEVRVQPSDLARDLLARAAPSAETPAAPIQAAARMDEGGGALSSLTVRGSSPDQGAAAWPGTNLALDAVSSRLDEARAQETELQRVDRLVRRLADQVNGQETSALAALGRQTAIAAALTPPPLPPLAAAIAAESVSPQPLPRMAAAEPISDQLVLNLSSAIAALPKWPEPEAEPAHDTRALERREAVLSALHAQRIDVYLEPILGLADQRPQHYEVSIGLKGGEGQHIDLAEAASSLSGTGLLPLIDSTRIAKAAQMARRLAERGKTGAVLTNFSAESLFDRETQADLTGRASAGAFPGQLVLMLPQSLVRLFTIADWQTLERLRAAGFGFALTDVTSLDVDFSALGEAGFTFARLDAETFLVGLPTSDGIVAPADICGHIAASGLAVIAGAIADDEQLARLFEFGVVFGQGQLFGGPRLAGGA